MIQGRGDGSSQDSLRRKPRPESCGKREGTEGRGVGRASGCSAAQKFTAKPVGGPEQGLSVRSGRGEVTQL